MLPYQDCHFKFQTQDGEITLIDFFPRSAPALESFINEHRHQKIYYFQKPDEAFNFGIQYSHLLYSPDLKFHVRDATLPPEISLEEGRSLEQADAVKELAIRNNGDNLIFHPEMLVRFNANTHLIERSGFCFQAIENNKVIGHASVVKVPDSIFGNREIYVLMRFIVDKPYRRTGLKEVLISKIAERIPENSPLYMQVFANNIVAKHFFLKRMNVLPFFEKWKV